MSDPPLPSPPLETCPRCAAPLVAGMVICPDCEIPLADLASAATGPLDPRGQLPASLDSGQTLGDRYTIVERVGAGGMGLIYKALDRKLGRNVALKMIQAGVADRPGARERFKREILLAQQVSHPNVCRLHDLGEFQGQPFISMEYVEGQTLETLIQSMGHLSPSQTVSLAKQICAGLAAIHQRGIVHRDLKPANIMVDRLGHVVLMDFGMAYHEDQERLTQAGAVFGTLGYLSPEQMRGRPEPRSDLYALGLILYEMLTGLRPPGDGDALPLALREKGATCPPPSHFSPEVPEALDQLVLRCLEREADKRYASSSELAEVLQQFEGPLTRSGILTREAALPPKTGRRPSVWLLAGAAVLAAIVALLAAGWRRPAAPPGPPSLAFLPLAYSGPGETAYLKQLLPLVLSQDLARADGLAVTPFSVSRGFEPGEPAADVARQLAVRLLVGGKIRDSGQGRLRLEIAAVDPAGRQVWSQGVEGQATELLAQRASLARSLAAAVGARPESALAGHDGEALRHYLEGLELLEGWDVPRNSERAVSAFEATLARDPDFAEAYAGQARAYLDLFHTRGDVDLVEKAAGAAQRALALAERLPEAHLAMGAVYLARGRSAQASEELAAAERLAPADDAICRQIAASFARTGKLPEAERAFQRAIALRPSYWQNYNAYGSHLLEAGRYDEARAQFERVIDLRPESDAGYSNLGAALILAGRVAEAEPHLGAALAIRPSEAVYNNLGFVYYAGGKYDLAARQWRAAIALGDELAEHYSNLGDALRHVGDRAGADQAYTRAVTLWRERLAVDSGDVAARAALAGALAGKGHCRDSLSELRHASVQQTRNPSAAYLAGIAAALCHDPAGARRFVLRAVEGGAVVDVRTNPDLRSVVDEPEVRERLARPEPRS